MTAVVRFASYVKRPVIIGAVLFTGDNGHELRQLIGESFSWNPLSRKAYISTLEGVMAADPGDWIIKGVKGEFYPCKPDVFEVTYKLVY